MKKKIAILGSTGSIGTQALNILSCYPEYYEIVALSAFNNIDLLIKQIKKYRPRKVGVVDVAKANQLKSGIADIPVESGEKCLIDLATINDVDVVVMAVVGIAGLKATLAALKAGKDVALANKETIVTGGRLVFDTAKQTGSKIIPVDSEHSAIFQCLRASNDHSEIRKIYLTASGGPFRGYNAEQLKNASVEQALKHPNWSMGKKVTIDSATLMNKGLEVIEAKWLFDLDIDQIEVIIHPQSIIHSMVEYVDGSIIAQMGKADMRIPILYALTHPFRLPTMIKPLNFIDIGKLTFEKPDINKFPCLDLAYSALKIGGTMPTVLNAANEVAVNKFLNKEISFSEIAGIIYKAMNKHETIKEPSIDDILFADQTTRMLLV